MEMILSIPPGLNRSGIQYTIFIVLFVVFSDILFILQMYKIFKLSTLVLNYKRLYVCIIRINKLNIIKVVCWVVYVFTSYLSLINTIVGYEVAKF